MKYRISSTWEKIIRDPDGNISRGDQKYIYLAVTIRGASAEEAEAVFDLYEDYFIRYEAEYVGRGNCDTDLDNGDHAESFAFKRIEGWVGSIKEDVAEHCRDLKKIVAHYDSIAAARANLEEIGNHRDFDEYLAAQENNTEEEQNMNIYHIRYIENGKRCWDNQEANNAEEAVEILNQIEPIPAQPLEILSVTQFDNYDDAIAYGYATDAAEAREDRLARQRGLNLCRKTLIECHQSSTTPAEAVDRLIETLGRDAARLIVAQTVIAKGDWDNRITDRTREWAAAVTEENQKSLVDLGFYYPDQIHPAHLEQIAYAMRIWQPTEEAPAADPDEIKIDDLRDDLDDGNYGEYLNDYRDSSRYICDAISEIADNHTSIYYSDILAFISEHPDLLADVIDEGLYDPSHDYDLYKHGQAAEFMLIERDLYDHLADALFLAALDFIRYDLERETIPGDLADQIREWCDDADSNDRMDFIPNSIREYFEQQEGDDE